MQTNTIVVNGLHPDLNQLISGIQENLDHLSSWQIFGMLLIAEENDNLIIDINTQYHCIKQGVYSLINMIKNINKISDIYYEVDLSNYLLNGESVTYFDDIIFGMLSVEADIIVNMESELDEENQKVKTTIIVYRHGNKRTLCASNFS